MGIAAIAVGVIVVGGILALVIGAPVPFLANSIAKRFQAETGYRLQVTGRAKIVRLWPSPTVTIGNIAVVDPSGSRPRTLATAEGLRMQLSLWSLVARRPQLAELAIARPMFQVPLLRQRTAPALAPAAPATTARATSAKVVTIDRLLVEDGAVEFVSPAGQVESRIDCHRGHRVAFGRSAAGPEGIGPLGRAGLARRYQRQASGRGSDERVAAARIHD